jgi:hypothetical protein
VLRLKIEKENYGLSECKMKNAKCSMENDKWKM